MNLPDNEISALESLSEENQAVHKPAANDPPVALSQLEIVEEELKAAKLEAEAERALRAESISELETISSELETARKSLNDANLELYTIREERDQLVRQCVTQETIAIESKRRYDQYLLLNEQSLAATQSNYEKKINSQIESIKSLYEQLKEASDKSLELRIQLDASRAEKIEMHRVNDQLMTRLSAPNVTTNMPSLEDVDERFGRGLADTEDPAPETLPTRHLIIPVHRPKITHLSNMFSRLEVIHTSHENVKISFIATDSAEQDAINQYICIFRPMIPADYEVVSGIDLCKKFDFHELAKYMAENRNGGNINVKKTLGLYSALIDGADEVMTADMDVVFFKHPKYLFDRAHSNFENKVFFAAYPTSELMRDIVLKSTEYFSAHDARILSSKMHHGEIYSWFFDAPYYPRHESKLFISHLQCLHRGMEGALLAMNWHSFDHILFMYFLSLHSGFTMVDIRKDISEFEATDSFSITDVLNISRKYSYRPAWASLPSILKADEQSLAELDFVVAIHSDRLA